jgi:methyl-accepting chemotaxis protein
MIFGLPSTATDVPALINIRRLATRGFIVFLWVMVAVDGFACSLSGMNLTLTLTITLVSAIAGTVVGMKDPAGLMARLVVAVCLMNDYDALIYATSYTGYQLDAHMLYFTLAAVLLSYFCWITLLVACVHTAVQHLSFNILMPYLVYPNGTDWIRFMYHAAILIIQFVGTGYIAIRVHRMFADGQRMVARLEATSAEAEALRGEQDTERARFAAETRVAMSRHADSFERQMTDQAAHLASSASLLQRTAQDMSSAASQASDRADAVGGAARQANGNVQAVAVSAEELLASVKEISRQVRHSASITTRAAEKAKGTDGTVRALAEGAHRIGEVVNMINGIASQTNLLALNATIEAARAGDAGKGFAVVAGEVKLLASQTAKATEEITSQVEQIQSTTREAVAAINEVANAISEVNEIAGSIAFAVDQQGAATQEITQHVQLAAAGTAHVTETFGEVSRTVLATGSGASSVLSAADELSSRAERLDGAVRKFLADVRSA